MFHHRLLLKLRYKCRMHIEVDLGLFSWKINLNFRENLFFEWDWIYDKIEIYMISKVF